MKLYSYFRSSAAFRVRIALNLKGVDYEIVPIHLIRDGGAHRTPAYRQVNPQMRVPALEVSPGQILIQSQAIIDYLDELYPDPPLLPPEPELRARIRAVAQIIACDIHPLNNSGTLAYLRDPLGHGSSVINAWYAHWVREGFDAVEELIRPAPYAFGAHVTLADVFLVPQVFNARRLKVPLDRYPKIIEVDGACRRLAAFEHAAPDNQPDAE
jgi:maleylacetoacetate isomerase